MASLLRNLNCGVADPSLISQNIFSKETTDSIKIFFNQSKNYFLLVYSFCLF